MADSLQNRLAGWRKRLGEFWWYALLFFLVQRVADVVNIYTGLWLIPRYVPQAELGAILPLTQVAGFLSMPLVLLLTPVGKYLNTFMTRGETGKARALLIDALKLSLVAAVVMVAYTLLAAPFIQLSMRVSGVGVMAVVCGMVFLNGIKPVLASSTQALKRFNNMLLGSVAQPFLRLGSMALLAIPFGFLGYMSAQFALDIFLTLLSASALWSLLRQRQVRYSYRAHWGEMFAFSLPLIVCSLLGSLADTLPPVVIRQRLPDVESAAYYVVTRFGDIPGSMGAILGLLLFPMISERHERGESSRRLLLQANLFSVGAGGAMVVALGLAGNWLLRLREPWAIYAPYAGLIWRLGLIQVLYGPINTFTTHEVACRRFGFLWFWTAMRLAMSLLLYVLTGWSFFEPYLPAAGWRAVGRLAAATRHIEVVIGATLAVQVLTLGALGLYLLWRRRTRGRFA